jgi:hypothetical protein
MNPSRWIKLTLRILAIEAPLKGKQASPLHTQKPENSLRDSLAFSFGLGNQQLFW